MSMQNDYIEPIDPTLRKLCTGAKNKLSYKDCLQYWLQYNRNQKDSFKGKSLNSFLAWLSKKDSQSDFSASYIPIIERYKHRMHIDMEETDRLWKGDKLRNFLKEVSAFGAAENKKPHSQFEYQCIHLRDWNDNLSANNMEAHKLNQFGLYCLKSTHGSYFVPEVYNNIRDYPENNLVINSNSLSSFKNTNLEEIFNLIIKNAGSSKKEVKIGIMGAVTNIKIYFLIYELINLYDLKNIYVCSDYTAGFDKEGHQKGLDDIREILGAAILESEEFDREFLSF